jgi:hypothetical protein
MVAVRASSASWISAGRADQPLVAGAQDDVDESGRTAVDAAGHVSARWGSCVRWSGRAARLPQTDPRRQPGDQAAQQRDFPEPVVPPTSPCGLRRGDRA